MKKEFKEKTNYFSKIYIENFCKSNNIALPVIIEEINNKIQAFDADNKKIKFNKEAEEYIKAKLNRYTATKAKILPEMIICYEVNF